MAPIREPSRGADEGLICPWTREDALGHERLKFHRSWYLSLWLCRMMIFYDRALGRDRNCAMPRLLFFYLSKRIAIAALVIAAGLCFPVVMTALFHQLPPAAIRGGLLMPALLGTLPTVLYIALPMAVGVAIALEFSRMSADGMIAVLYSLRLSVWSLCAPALVVALMAIGAGYWLSSWFAPTYVGQLHDVLYVIRNSLNHRMLEPAHFYTFDKGARTLYFERWRSADVATGMFIHQFSAEKNEEQIINA